MRGGEKALRVAVLVATLSWAPPLRADGPYARPARLAYLARALDALRGLGPEGTRTLAQELQVGARRRCRAELGVPSAACLVDLGRATCEARPPAGRPGCHVAADIILTNQRSETELVDEPTRLRLLGQGANFRAAMNAELRLRYTVLAAELALAEPGSEGELPARIDRFCAARDRPLAWQRCAAAIVWYIGTSEPGAGSMTRP